MWNIRDRCTQQSEGVCTPYQDFYRQKGKAVSSVGGTRVPGAPHSTAVDTRLHTALLLPLRLSDQLHLL